MKLFVAIWIGVFACSTFSTRAVFAEEFGEEKSAEYDASLSFLRTNRIALGSKSNGWYFAPHVGMNMISNTATEGFTIKFDTGIAFGAGFGTEIKKDLAFQFDFGFIRNDIDELTNDSTDATSAPDVEYTQIPFLFNLIWSPTNHPDLRPYAGVGIGFIRGDYESNEFISSDDEWAFAARVQVGFQIDLSPRSRLSFGYQFTLANYSDSIDNHTIGLGIQFKF